MSDEDRIARLEMTVAEQERTIEELSGQVAEQWSVIDRLQKTLEAVTRRFVALEESTAPDVPITKPPHW